MIGLLVFVALIATAILQATVSPLFPLFNAQADFGLLLLAWLCVFRGPRTVMWAIPFMALFSGFLIDRSPGLLIIGYLPLVPMMAAMRPRDTNVIFGSYWRVALTVALTGGFLRTLLALTTMLQGGEIAVLTLIFGIVIPGFILDAALLTVAYLPARLIGWNISSMSLSKGGYASI